MKSGTLCDVDRFLLDCCEIQPVRSISVNTLFDEYAVWCHHEFLRPVRKSDFDDWVKKTPGVTKTWQGKPILIGIRVKKGG